MNTKGRLHEVFAEDFRRELAEIESKEGRRLFVLAKANRLMHFRIAEYEVLIAAAEMTGPLWRRRAAGMLSGGENGVGERTRQLIRDRLEQRLAA